MRPMLFISLLAVFLTVACGKNQTDTGLSTPHFDESVPANTASQIEENVSEEAQVGAHTPTRITNRAGNGEPVGGSPNTTEVPEEIPVSINSLSIQLELQTEIAAD